MAVDQTQRESEFTPKPGFHIVYKNDKDRIVWLTGTRWGFPINKTFKQHAQLKRWCEENCKDTVTYYIGEFNLHHIYFFDEYDAAAFKLRWISEGDEVS